VILGLMFGLAMGGAVAILLEAIDPAVHTARQLQATLRLPVLASIPQIWLESDRAAQRRGRIRAAFATVAVGVFALVGGAVNYAWVNGGRSEAAVEATAAAAPAVAAPAGPPPPETPAAPPEGETLVLPAELEP